MVCPNCQSVDIVELQNEHFCINCGRLIELVTKKRGPGRPKATRLDKPKPLTIKLAGKAAAAALDQPLGAKVQPEAQPANSIEAVVAVEAESTDTPIPVIAHKFNPPSPPTVIAEAPKVPEEVAKLAEVKVRRRLQDILPAQAAELIPDETALPIPQRVSSRLPLSRIVTAAWSEPWQGGPARILIVSALLSGLATAGSLTLVLFSNANLSNIVVESGFSAFGLGLALLFGVANTERAAFALRRYDHRPIPRSWLFGGALSALGRQTTVLVAGLIDGGLLLALGLYLGYELPQLLEQPYSAVALLLSYLLITLLLLLVWVKTGLAAAGVELGRISALEGIRFGWRSLWKHPELIGSRLVAALWLAASLSGVIAIAYLVHLYLPTFDRWTIIVASSLVAFTAVLLGNFGAVGWRQACYRELVIIDEPEHAIARLSGHHNGAPSRSAHFSYVFIVTLLILGGIGAVLSSIIH